ncbi:EAL domain-containing protein [Rhizobium sp. RU36D]|uniref:putative bifunctional diguanylate cyclase/phosphodiesterase n=1 Tax=Rhizobium sp. RU36D TaxID=1907415 RepID=UPI0009D88526|nr:EAL domain-containing protein [Rhizobium sp. RU36D]SMC59543.1 diguanylate cyclase (GGDEF) domain-containing protein [Rhizobium sp. RU36D]
MMLRTFSPGSLWRYVFAGSALGAVAPLTTLYLLASPGDPWSGFHQFTSDPLLFATAALPAATGYLAYQIGWRTLQLRQRIHELEHRRRELQEVASRDPLTGIGNRLAMEQALQARMAKVNKTSTAVLAIDLDRFKFVNDTMGHDTGDSLLIALTQRLKQVLGGRGEIYRLGGDEFVILLDGCATPQAVEPYCLDLAREASTPFELAQGRVATGLSIGVTFVEEEDDSIGQVLKRADLALYRAKADFGSAHTFYEPLMAAEDLRMFEIERDLGRALSEGEFFLEYQPIIGIKSGKVRSLEALLRWRHPSLGVISPEVFVPLAERSGMILAIGKWVVQKACSEAVKWPAPVGVGVNVSGDQFKDRGFVAYILGCLDDSGLAPGRLTIEVTEAVFSVDIQLVRESLAQLRAAGVRVALDDFGTGFSSINNLKVFPLDQLKIDRSFAREMLETTRDARLVDLIRLLSETFQIDTTIEGIETRPQLDFVRALGIEEAQGFLISRPVAADMVPDLLTPDRNLFAVAS